jgi:hypothetical protein
MQVLIRTNKHATTARGRIAGSVVCHADDVNACGVATLTLSVRRAGSGDVVDETIRKSATDFAAVPIAGSDDSDLRRFVAPFAFSFDIKVELADYDVRLVAGSSVMPQSELVGEATKVCAGDLYLISGQSNAWAYTLQDTTPLQRPWLRSFGVATEDESMTINDREWRLAQAGEQTFVGGSVNHAEGRFVVVCVSFLLLFSRVASATSKQEHARTYMYTKHTRPHK